MNNDTWQTPGEMLQWYIICALADTLLLILLSLSLQVLTIITKTHFWHHARDDNLVKSDAKKCQQHCRWC
jgi:hypothetical protein